MNLSKFAVLGTFAAGAALGLAPLASAAPDPTLVTDVLSGEESLLNSIFVGNATVAGVPSADYSLVDGFEVVKPQDVAFVQGGGTTPFDFLTYGVNPSEAGLAGDPGSYNDFNGALVEFDNAYNVELYSLFNNGDLVTNAADYIQNNALDHALTLGTTTAAADYLFNFGLGDLEGFFGIFTAP